MKVPANKSSEHDARERFTSLFVHTSLIMILCSPDSNNRPNLCSFPSYITSNLFLVLNYSVSRTCCPVLRPAAVLHKPSGLWKQSGNGRRGRRICTISYRQRVLDSFALLHCGPVTFLHYSATSDCVIKLHSVCTFERCYLPTNDRNIHLHFTITICNTIDLVNLNYFIQRWNYHFITV